jgi:type III restriction enzyme
LASQHAAGSGGKPWKYLLIPHDVISENMTLAGLVSWCAASG